MQRHVIQDKRKRSPGGFGRKKRNQIIADLFESSPLALALSHNFPPVLRGCSCFLLAGANAARGTNDVNGGDGGTVVDFFELSGSPREASVVFLQGPGKGLSQERNMHKNKHTRTYVSHGVIG